MGENAIGRHKQGVGLAFRHAVEYGFRFSLLSVCITSSLVALRFETAKTGCSRAAMVMRLISMGSLLILSNTCFYSDFNFLDGFLQRWLSKYSIFFEPYISYPTPVRWINSSRFVKISNISITKISSNTTLMSTWII